MAKGKEQWRERKQWKRNNNGKGERMMTQGRERAQGEGVMAKGKKRWQKRTHDDRGERAMEREREQW
jgi:hypothetical protein